MIFKEYWSIYPIKKEWEILINKNTDKIYQTYSFNALYYQYRITSLSNIRSHNTKCRFVVGYKDGEIKCIAPLAIDKSPQKTLRLLGHGTNAGYLDYIYQDPECAVELHNYIKNKYSDCTFDYIFVPEKSPLVQLMNVEDTFNNYAISLNCYEEYFNALSKSTRQNVRTAYNRINKDGFQYQLEIYNSYSELTEEKLNVLNKLYHKRKADWVDGEILSEKTQNKVLKRDVIYNGVRKLDNTIVALLKIDSKVAAFFIGFTYKNGICIPRLAIDIEFGRYSPGMILINEYLKKIRNSERYVFDLCRGDEKYKSSLGGEKSITYRLSH